MSARVSFTILETPVYMASVNRPIIIASMSTSENGRLIIKITKKKIPKSAPVAL